MLSVFFITILFSGSFADLLNSATHGDTVLEYYNYNGDQVNTAGAMARCWQLGGWLVMPKYYSLDTAAATVSGNAYVWIGLGDFGAEGAYEYIDGSRVTWSNWRGGEPSQHTDEDCAEIRDKGWNDKPCSYHIGYVCQIPMKQRTRSHYSHFKVYQGVNETTYEKATAACARRKSRLVKIADDHSTQMLFNKLALKTEFAFWTSKEGTDTASCYTASLDSVDVATCEQKRPYICETVKPHKVIVSEEEPVVSEYSNLEICCSAYGYPVPEVTWFRNDVEVVDQVKTKGHSTLKLQDVTSVDSGLYVCRAENVVDNRDWKMEGYSIVKVTQAEGMENSRSAQNDDMY